MRYILIIISLFLVSCLSAPLDKQQVNKEDVKYIEIRKGADTVRLNQQQAEDLIQKWNTSKAKGLYKFITEYFLTVHFEGDSILSFRINQDLMKQNSDWAFSIGDTNYFNKIWAHQIITK